MGHEFRGICEFPFRKQLCKSCADITRQFTEVGARLPKKNNQKNKEKSYVEFSS